MRVSGCSVIKPLNSDGVLPYKSRLDLSMRRGQTNPQQYMTVKEMAQEV